MARRNKYGNKKVTVDGIVFDSKREARRWTELKLLESAGEIYNLQRQVEFLLLPKQYSKTEFTKAKKPRLVEREVKFIADFVYMENGELVVEDVKGYNGKESYIIKRKLMLHVHGIQVKEV